MLATESSYMLDQYTAANTVSIFLCLSILGKNLKMLELRLKFHWSLFLRVNQQYFSIGSGNGLAPTRQQAINWSNGG